MDITWLHLVWAFLVGMLVGGGSIKIILETQNVRIDLDKGDNRHQKGF